MVPVFFNKKISIKIIKKKIIIITPVDYLQHMQCSAEQVI